MRYYESCKEREFERIGGNRLISVDVRVINATNRDWRKLLKTACFASDLFYRLSVFPIELPPLRERKEDIPMLVEYFIDRFARKTGKRVWRIKKKTLDQTAGLFLAGEHSRTTKCNRAVANYK